MTGAKSNKFPMVIDNISVKKLVHDKLKGYREYEVNRKIFETEIDYNFYNAVKENNQDTIKELIKNGHSADRVYKEQTLRLITKDNVYIDNFEKFNTAIKAYETGNSTPNNLSIVEKIKESKSLLSISIDNNSLDITGLLLKGGANPNIKDIKLRFLSDYKETPLLNIVSNIGKPYSHVTTVSSTATPVITPLIEKNKTAVIRLIINNSKFKIDLNEPKTVLKRTYSNEGNKSTKIITRPIESAIKNKNNKLTNYLIIRGASINLASPEYRNAYRKLEPEMDKIEHNQSINNLFNSLGNTTNNMDNNNLKNTSANRNMTI